MAESEKQIICTIEAALKKMPNEMKQYFLGFAEGVAAMASLKEPPLPNKGGRFE